ncbi:YraN family protein [Bifidobacterium aquikefiricola]|uniref:UPF0102 protein QN215_04970 n=1 Tax=Bifidobacterium aquikefiricola TaxID=3059038 RepID=A0AB39U8Z0_9BIFI
MNIQLAEGTHPISPPSPNQLLDPGLSPKSLGMLGERYAEHWLICRGWRILGRNWQSRYGELDIIAVDTDGMIVFVEVKTRRNRRFGNPQDAVDYRKQRNLRRAGSQWLCDTSHRVAHHGVRFDVVAISVLGNTVYVNHLRSAFA